MANGIEIQDVIDYFSVNLPNSYDTILEKILIESATHDNYDIFNYLCHNHKFDMSNTILCEINAANDSEYLKMIMSTQDISDDIIIHNFSKIAKYHSDVAKNIIEMYGNTYILNVKLDDMMHILDHDYDFFMYLLSCFVPTNREYKNFSTTYICKFLNYLFEPLHIFVIGVQNEDKLLDIIEYVSDEYKNYKRGKKIMKTILNIFRTNYNSFSNHKKLLEIINQCFYEYSDDYEIAEYILNIFLINNNNLKHIQEMKKLVKKILTKFPNRFNQNYFKIFMPDDEIFMYDIDNEYLESIITLFSYQLRKIPDLLFLFVDKKMNNLIFILLNYLKKNNNIDYDILLIYCCNKGSTEIVEYLLTNFPNINIHNYGDKAIKNAVKAKFYEIVDLLIDVYISEKNSDNSIEISTDNDSTSNDSSDNENSSMDLDDNKSQNYNYTYDDYKDSSDSSMELSFYHRIHSDSEYVFRKLCKYGEIKLAQKIKYNFPETNHHVLNNICYKTKYPEILSWLESECYVGQHTKSARK